MRCPICNAFEKTAIPNEYQCGTKFTKNKFEISWACSRIWFLQKLLHQAYYDDQCGCLGDLKHAEEHLTDQSIVEFCKKEMKINS